MSSALPVADYNLACAVAFTLPARRRPWVLHCLHGRLWVTHAASRQDHILGRGDRLRVPAGAAVVVEALRDASFDCEAAPHTWPDIGRVVGRILEPGGAF